MIDPRTEKTLAMALHLSGFLNGILPLVVPFLIWALKKDESQFINEHGKSALNFQLTVLIIGISAVIFTFLTFGFGAFIIVPVAVILGLLYIIFIIIATLKANDGQLYKYPVSIELIK